ncbi:MAG: hypothetical protein R3C59_04125 [Planctomycetaceae bacterium]
MPKRKNIPPGSLLELWRPPTSAGDALGCLTSTFTFDATLFEEQCLARFLEIESDPAREDAAFLLERENRLGEVYAAVLVDRTQAGVQHSLRWDVLPVRIPNGKQHSKISLLAWTNQVRVIVASANLTEPGYRFNQEVAIAFDSDSKQCRRGIIEDTIRFLGNLLAFVPGADQEHAAGDRAVTFLKKVESLVQDWTPINGIRGQQQSLVFTLPGQGTNPATGSDGFDATSSLEMAQEKCQRAGGLPEKVWVASPFFDDKPEEDSTTRTVCSSMARGGQRSICFCVCEDGEGTKEAVRLLAPRSLLTTASSQLGRDRVTVEVLPQQDSDRNRRPWHAKMLRFERHVGTGYTAIMIGSSSFTQAGMGVSPQFRNAEANVLTIVEHHPHAREPGMLRELWPETRPIEDLDANGVEWKGSPLEEGLEPAATGTLVPSGFVAAFYCVGEPSLVTLLLKKSELPLTWSISTRGLHDEVLTNHEDWLKLGQPTSLPMMWEQHDAPERLTITWRNDQDVEFTGILPFNAQDVQTLPPPMELQSMTADQMLLILCADNIGAALRAWSRKERQSEGYDEDLDTATPTDLDPLRQYDLRATFLRRVRIRARILQRLREKLQQPVGSLRSLHWRLDGFVGVRPLTERMVDEVLKAIDRPDEALLNLADLFVLLLEVDYQPQGNSLSREEFDAAYSPFLSHLAADAVRTIKEQRHRFGSEIFAFWKRVTDRCEQRASAFPAGHTALSN